MPAPEQLWLLFYKKLEAFKHEYGHCKVPSQIKELRSLYDWTCQQRAKDKRNTLTPERKELLTNIGFVWAKEIKKNRLDRWEEKFKELVAYKEKFGTVIVSSIDPEYRSLRIWTDKLRLRQDKLHAARKKKLLSIGFPLKEKVQTEKDVQWNAMYLRLRAYYRKHQHSRVSIRDKNDPELGQWVATQREKKDTLTKEQRKKLMQLKFIWDIQKHIKTEYDQHWEKKFKLMEEFYQKHGHSKITERHGIKGMVRWMITQRKNMYKLSAEQVKKLNRVQFEWTISYDQYHQQLWDKYYSELLAYYKLHGNCHVPIHYKENPALGPWVYNVGKGKIKLNDAMKKQLQDLHFEWPEKIRSFEERWQTMYKKLLAFYKQHKHTRVPIKGDTEKLYYWLRNQKRLDAKNKLKKEHRKLLDKIWDQ